MAGQNEARTGGADSPGKNDSPAAVASRERAHRRRVAFELPHLEERTTKAGKVRYFMANPSPLRDMSPAQRFARVVGLMEAAAMAGDVNAARELVKHHQWRTEMTKGKPPQSHKIDAVARVEVYDSISELPADVLEQMRGLVQQAGQGKPIGALPDRIPSVIEHGDAERPSDQDQDEQPGEE